MINKLLSMKAAVLVMLIFAASIGYATFIENDYGTQTARALIYNAKWFEILLLYFIVILTYNIFKFKMYKRQKWGQFILHLGFIMIAVGAVITRYIGYEGVLHLRDKQVSNKMVSDYMNLSLHIKDGNKRYVYDKKLELSSMTKNSMQEKIKANNKEIDIKLLKYLPTAKEELIEDANGTSYIEMMVSSMGSRGEIKHFKEGEVYDLGGGKKLSFNSNQKGDINIIKDGDKLYLETNSSLSALSMATKESKTLNAGKNELKKRYMYSLNGVNFVLKDYKPKAKLKYISPSIKSGGKYPQMIELLVKSGKESKIVRLFGRKSIVGDIKHIKINGLDLGLQYGAKIIELPFFVKLDKFVLDRYPGSMSPSSYSSFVTIIDKEKNKNFKYHIYMNHVLDYRGYRFFQSSYDMDEKGSILSVNHDPGTIPTYIGYLMLVIGFLWSFLSEKGRIKTLLKKLDKLKNSNLAIAILFSISLYSSQINASTIDTSNITKDELKLIKNISKKHSEKFARLIVQESSGRMSPMDTLDLEIVKKISGKRGFLGLNYNQIYIGMLTKPEIYNKLRIVKISHPLVNKKIGLPKSAKYAAFSDFFEDGGKGDYKLKKDLETARTKRAAEQSKYDKEIIKIDERLNVLYMAEQGVLLRVFPKPNDPNNTWSNPLDALKTFPKKEADFVRNIISSYLQSLLIGMNKGDWSKADSALDILKKYQEFYGSKLIPQKDKVETEILYNRIDIFKWLIIPYILIGMVLLIMAFISIIKPSINIKLITKVVAYLLVITLIIHTIGLIVRWYLAGHAPWSNAYESILFIAWATALAGFVFAKRSPLSFAATSILTGIFLLVAWISDLNPQITNLVPVLKSYWLMIHVAVITSSYGFLGLGALLGMFVLLLMIINKKRSEGNIVNAIKELTIINEITLFIGLALITIGNFLGGVWANESWGRYWSWDPKETWAAVTILVYAAILHMRFIKKLNSIYAFNVAAVLAYFSVIMTYFGVNYYLSGMHSYAAGDPVPIPVWVYFAVAGVFALIGISRFYKIDAKL